MLVIETNIDDMNPQHLRSCDGAFVRRRRARCLSRADPDEEKPSRHSAHASSAEPHEREKLAEIILQETSDHRHSLLCGEPMILKRKSKNRKNPIWRGDGQRSSTNRTGRKRATPEYDDLKRLAKAKQTTAQTHSRRSDAAGSNSRSLEAFNMSTKISRTTPTAPRLRRPWASLRYR